jgi:hypothetical protein
MILLLQLEELLRPERAPKVQGNERPQDPHEELRHGRMFAQLICTRRVSIKDRFGALPVVINSHSRS